MQKISVIIADDERPAREFLKAVLLEFRDVQLIGEAENGAEAVEMIRERRPDLALLDLQMPEVSGLEVVRALPKNLTPLVAFVTAYDDYAVQAFEVNAVDYLLKPVERDRLRETINRAHERLEHEDWRNREAENLNHAIEVYEEVSRSELIERIPVKKRDGIFLVPVSDVASIVADGELLFISTEKGERHVINFRLKDLEVRLDPSKFVRLSRGALANLDMVTRVAPMPGGTYLITLRNGQEIPTSRIQSRVLRTKLFKL